MITVKEAENLISQNLLSPKSTELNIENLKNEILCEELRADRNYPPFHRVAMDGIAIHTDLWNEGTRSFKIQALQKAGEPAKTLEEKSNCIEIMTGAVLPAGCNAIIRYEDTNIENGIANVKADLKVSDMMNVHQEGVDYKTGDLLVSDNPEMLAPHWSIAASVGKANLRVFKRPRITLVSTGDELVDVSSKPAAHQVRRSNSYTLLSSLRLNGFNDIAVEHLKDEPKEIFSKLESILDKTDVLILSGGVSMGKFDFIPKCLADLQVKQVFHKVRQRPGKPLWFGVTGKKQMVFGLPGNPVSSLICLHRYVLPSLWKAIGRKNKTQPYTILEEDLKFTKPLTYFPAVSIRYGTDGKTYARPVKSNGSGDFASLAKSNGFIELDEKQDVFKQGQAFPLFYWKE